jgi:hypothetical protein
MGIEAKEGNVEGVDGPRGIHNRLLQFDHLPVQ